MGREGQKVIEGEGKKQEFLGLKLKRGILVGAKGSSTSTPSITWSFGVFGAVDGSLLQEFNIPSNTHSLRISARKLGANLWDIQPHQLKVIKMMNNKVGERQNKLRHPDKHIGLGLLNQLSEPPDSPWEKMDPYRSSSAPSSSRKFERNFGESTNYSLITSTGLVKVLNRIWSIEEQHASTKSLVKALKRELDHAQTRIEELLQQKKRGPDNLEKELVEDRIIRENTDLLQSMRNDLEDERKLRKNSESLHKKLGRELSEARSSFFSSLKELERERSARVLLEELCDEFAKGIKAYEQEVRFHRQKSKNDPVAVSLSHNDGLILHLSEAWLDERMQVKQEDLHSDPAENKTVVEKLSCEIETLLMRAKSNGRCCKDDLCDSKEPSRSNLCGQSLESFHLKEAASAPRRNEEESIISDFFNVELKRGPNVKKTNHWSKKQVKRVLSKEAAKRAHSSKLKAQLEECVSASVSNKASSTQHANVKSYAEKGCPQKERKKKEQDSQNYVKAKFLRTNSLPAQGKQIQHDNLHVEYAFDPAKFTGLARPVENWTSAVTATIPETSDSSSKRSQSVKENTLRALLLEARLESQRARSIASKGTFLN